MTEHHEAPIIKAFFSMEDIAGILASTVRKVKGKSGARYRCDLEYTKDGIIVILSPPKGGEPALNCMCPQCLAYKEENDVFPTCSDTEDE